MTDSSRFSCHQVERVGEYNVFVVTIDLRQSDYPRKFGMLLQQTQKGTPPEGFLWSNTRVYIHDFPKDSIARKANLQVGDILCTKSVQSKSGFQLVDSIQTFVDQSVQELATKSIASFFVARKCPDAQLVEEDNQPKEENTKKRSGTQSCLQDPPLKRRATVKPHQEVIEIDLDEDDSSGEITSQIGGDNNNPATWVFAQLQDLVDRHKELQGENEKIQLVREKKLKDCKDYSKELCDLQDELLKGTENRGDAIPPLDASRTSPNYLLDYIVQLQARNKHFDQENRSVKSSLPKLDQLGAALKRAKDEIASILKQDEQGGL